MPLQSRYLFIASMDVDPRQQSLFNEVYNTEHCPPCPRCRVWRRSHVLSSNR